MGGQPEDRYDIKDLAVAPDGLHVAFAMRGPLDDVDDEDEPPTWNIWEYNIETDALRRVISSDIIAEEGQDVAPGYLPDGRILFSSTRQRQSKAILLDENKQQFEAANETRNESAFVLHVMNADGTDIHQITFNPSSDLYASVLQNGRVLFTRWDTGGRQRRPASLHHESRRHRHAAALRCAVACHRHATAPPTTPPSSSCARAR